MNDNALIKRVTVFS